MKNAVRVEIGISRVESETRVGVTWRRRSEAEILVPVIACECTHCRPGSAHPALDEETQKLRNGFACAFEIHSIRVAIHSQEVVHTPSQFKIERPNHPWLRIQASHRFAIVTKWPANACVPRIEQI